MSTTTESHGHAPAEQHHHDEHVEPGGHAHPADGLYVRIAIILAVFTALEIWIGESGGIPTWFKLTGLIVLMVVKFALVVLFFMHLRFDAKLFGRMFWGGLLLALAVYLGTLATFQFFT